VIKYESILGKDFTEWCRLNKGLVKVVVQYSADKFVVNQSLVLRINTDCIWDVENPQLRQSQKRYVLFPHSEYHAY